MIGRLRELVSEAIDFGKLVVEVVRASYDVPPLPAAQHDETASWPVPMQDPHTAESRAMEYRPPPPAAPPAPPAPLKGSVQARIAEARSRASRSSG